MRMCVELRATLGTSEFTVSHRSARFPNLHFGGLGLMARLIARDDYPVESFDSREI